MNVHTHYCSKVTLPPTFPSPLPMCVHGRVTPVMRVPMEHLVNKVRRDSRVTLATQDLVVIKEDL